MDVRFKEKSKIFDVGITAVGAVFSIGTVLYGVFHLGLRETWPELVLNLFYIACVVMMWMYFFKFRITFMQFNYWCSMCVGAALLLRDILFPPPLAYYALHLACLVLSVLLLLMLTYFYARKEWKTYSKRNLWMICIIDMVIFVHGVDVAVDDLVSLHVSSPFCYCVIMNFFEREKFCVVSRING